MAMCLSVCVCVCLYLSVSVTTRCSTKAAKCKIMKIKLHDSPETLVFWCQRSTRNSTRVNPCGGARCSWGGLKQRLSTNSWLYLGKRYKIDTSFLFKSNRKSYALYRMVTLPMTLSDPSRPKLPHFFILHPLLYLRNGCR